MNLLDMLEPLPELSLDSPLFTYKEPGKETVLSRAEFRARAHAIASHVASLVKAGDRVVLVYPPGPEFLCAFAGVLCAGAIAVPVYPPDGRPHSVERFLALITDCDAVLALGTAEVCAQTALVPELSRLRWLATDTISSQDASLYRRPRVDPDAIAFLQYTSGSTGLPRGVVHTHRNVLANMELICKTMGVVPGSRSVLWLPVYHDMGLITALMSLRHADHMRIMSPLSFLRDPIEWLRCISAEQASHSGGPNFAYDLCVRRLTPEDVATLDLRSWTYAYNGAEPIRPDTLDRFAQAFAPCGFRRSAFLPCYGLAEATLLVSVGPCGGGATLRALDEKALALGRAVDIDNGGSGRPLIASGMVHDEAEVAIVDPETSRRCAPDRIGEIWVRGPGIGAGYWRMPEESERTFRARIEPTGDGPFLRTGDLGFVRGGQLFVTGRLKDLIVIRGQNYYPQDIEEVAVAAHAAVRQGCCVAVPLAGADGEEVGVFFELDKSLETNAVLSEVLTKVLENVSERCALAPKVVGVLKRGTLPKTSSGKVQRSRCRDSFLRNELTLLALHDVRPESAAAKPASNGTIAPAAGGSAAQVDEELVAAVQARLLEEISDIVKTPVDADAIVTRLGITSLTAIEVMFAVEQEFGLTIAPALLAKPISVRELARGIVAGDTGAARVEVTSERASVPSRERAARRPLEFSLMYFSTDTQPTQERYDILLRSARFADDHGFRALWLPERHFHAFGGTYPNPAIAAAALALATRRVRLRAGSVVLPLHNPLRVAEDWSMVDNLSGGRVDLSFATGWNPNDFVIAPERFEQRRAITFDGIEQVRRLWSGQKLELPNGRGEPTAVGIHPEPIQRELEPWFTCTASAEGFVEAGERGFNVLTALLFQRIEDLELKIGLYRQARARSGHDPDAGVVTLMLHTFVGRSLDSVHRKVASPFKRYLASSIDLWKHEWTDLAPKDGVIKPELLDVAFQRYAQGNALFGTPASCAEFAQRVQGIGVDEIACLIDFGVAADDVIDALVYLDDLRARSADRGESASNEQVAVH